jgi:hypothetical protein
VLANDFARAIQHSHPANSIQALKNTVGWMQDQWPTMSYGNLQVVHHWMALDAAERRPHLEQAHLIYTEQDEIMLVLGGVRTFEPFLD